ncbi:hypothetical protein [Lacrimispora sphenoides]|uniref:Uncharacterized protein n=2 Tax=Lacrimispora TaxID=2719231 RepID=A0ABY1CJT0_9FIRM|nr:hypothetical protein [Lacrimispora sphenoides]MDR7812774.1 hypothetical protein [Lacrimispora sp.]SEU08013.1 hypothetical protein SAMN02745906_4736 [[Clostridium] sphenoides JCM 1415]SUY49300.1 Uncharacterised protein [Lacrimispora sphenoides]
MYMNDLGTITQMGRILQVNNAMVTEVFTRSRATGYIDIIYSQSVQNETISEPLRLNASFYTDVLNLFGQHICLCDIEEGMVVDALFSPIMEWRIPPQANAYLIVAKEYGQPSFNSTTALITEVDIDKFLFYTYDPDNPDNQIEFHIATKATVRDTNGNPVPFRTLYPGLLVNVIHSEIQTAFIPYQAIAFHIQIL